jgi:hypothetical protein
MIGYRIRIVLLSLGVLLGYGSAFSRLVYGRPLFRHHDECTSSEAQGGHH